VPHCPHCTAGGGHSKKQQRDCHTATASRAKESDSLNSVKSMPIRLSYYCNNTTRIITELHFIARALATGRLLSRSARPACRRMCHQAHQDDGQKETFFGRQEEKSYHRKPDARLMSTLCNRSGMVAWAVHARFANTMMYIVHSHIGLRDALLRGSLDEASAWCTQKSACIVRH
jgi:hypothetical protein